MARVLIPCKNTGKRSVSLQMRAISYRIGACFSSLLFTFGVHPKDCWSAAAKQGYNVLHYRKRCRPDTLAQLIENSRIAGTVNLYCSSIL